MIMDENGYVEILKEIVNVLDLGIYYVIEIKVFNGFVNIFKFVKVELKYVS